LIKLFIYLITIIMKRLYLFLASALFSAAIFAQIGPDWWMYLPADWRTNPYVRDTIMIANVADDFVGGYDVLATLWEDVEAEAVPIDYKNSGPDADGDADFGGNCKVFWDNTNLYILFNVIDQEVDTAKDYVEVHTAPYNCYYDPGRTIYPQGFCPGWIGNPTPDPYDYEFGDVKITGLEYVAMAKVGSWTEAGAYKMDIKLKTMEELYPAAVTYTLRGPDKDTLGNVSSGSPEIPLTSVFESTAEGYLFLVIEPWSIMNDMVPEDGVFDAMSIGVKVNDMDSDNADGDDEDTAPDKADYWAGCTNNNGYWAVAYYCAVGKFFDKEIPACTLPSGISNYATAIEVASEGGTEVTAADQTLQMTAAITPEDADVQYVQWSVAPDSAVIDGEGMLSGFKAGTYTVTVTAAALDGSGVTGTLDINVDIQEEPSGTHDNKIAKITAYPSPVKDILTLSNTQKVTRIDVINIVGQPVATYDNNGSSTMKLNVSDFRPGIYLLNARSREGVTTLRFTKQ
jgi:hypothetical protein